MICGLLGIPPSNGVLPQSPMHTKSLAVLKRQVCRKFENLLYPVQLKMYSLANAKNLDFRLFNYYIVLLFQLIRKKMVNCAKESIRQKASSTEIFGKMEEIFIEMDERRTPVSNYRMLKEIKFYKYMEIYIDALIYFVAVYECITNLLVSLF